MSITFSVSSWQLPTEVFNYCSNKYLLIQTAYDGTVFSIIPQVLKSNNRADTDSTHKQIITIVDVGNITKEFLNDRIHTLITYEKLKRK